MHAPGRSPSLLALWRAHALAHPLASLGFVLALAGILGLLLHGGQAAFGTESTSAWRFGLLGGLAGFLSTALGALPALFVRALPQRAEDTLLGFAAGMMLAASAFSLLLPGLDAGEAFTGNAIGGAALVIAGLALGVLLMLGLDRFTPHAHPCGGPCGAGCERFGKVALFIFAIALHNLPEGMAIGVSFAQSDLSVGLPLTSAIGVQNLPEGLAVALLLRGIGLSPLAAVSIAAATGLMEPIGAMLGLGLAGGMAAAYPIGLGLAAGAMLFVVSHEVIPETHRNGHQTAATLGMMSGFALMLLLDAALSG